MSKPNLTFEVSGLPAKAWHYFDEEGFGQWCVSIEKGDEATGSISRAFADALEKSVRWFGLEMPESLPSIEGIQPMEWEEAIQR